MSSSAFGYALTRLGADAYDTPERVPDWHDASREVWRPCCTDRKCDGRPEFIASYRYVTGKAGRVSSQRRYVCQAHAEAFAKKHGLELPA
jgi:hypothetical protein